MTPTDLKAFLNRHGLNQEQFASVIGVKPMAVSNWINGRRAMSLTTSRLCRLFDRSPELMKGFVQ